jgi:hypothetical protein
MVGCASLRDADALDDDMLSLSREAIERNVRRPFDLPGHNQTGATTC